MPQINNLPTRTLSAGDLLPFFSTANGDAAKTSITSLAALIGTLLGITALSSVTQFESPEESFEIDVEYSDRNTWLVLTPTAAGYTGTINFPAATSATDQMEITVSSDEAINITFASTGATFIDVVTSLNQGGAVTYKYESVLKRWYGVSSYTGTQI